MAELATIARPYAQALHSAAGSQDDCAAALERLAALVGQADVAAALTHPGLPDARRSELLASLAGGSLPGPVAALLQLVIENGRVAALPEISAQFRALRNAQAGSADCLIESAFPLEGAELEALVASLTRKFPQRLQPQVRLNPALIGGVRVVVGDRVLDGSVRARLDAMRARLTA
jgi:F-type H+-transporting ATPase subunit delta